jgi:hypothetical protein
MIEVCLDKVENAAAVRKAFAEKSKSRLLTGDHERLFSFSSIGSSTDSAWMIDLTLTPSPQ